MPSPELNQDDPSVAFGRNQGLFVYTMASSMTGETNRPVIERANDAARTAIRQFDCGEDINPELATAGLMSALEENISAKSD